MQKRTMTTKEHIRETVLKELITGTINGTEAAQKIGVTVRQVKRLKHVFMVKGRDGLIHQSRGVEGSRKTLEFMEKQVIEIIRREYCDFGPLLAWEKLREIHGVNLGRETIRQMMIRAGIWKAKQRRKSEYHCWRERKEAFGELILRRQLS